MRKKRYLVLLLPVLLATILATSGWSQSFNATISGLVTDPSGAVVPDAELTLTEISTGAVTKLATGSDGLFRFPNLPRGSYELKVSAKGFRDFLQRGINISINESVRVDIKLEVGAEAQTIEVEAGASPLNFENAEVKGTVTPDTIKELPLLVGGATRSAADFVLLLPGVSTGGGGGSNRMVARFSGGMVFGDEAVLDGVTMQEGLLSQTGMIAFEDYPISPDAVSEVSVLTSNYEPQYGSTTSAVITAVTKSGTNELHGGGYWYHRNDALNARPFGAVDRPIDKEHDFGSFVGGPIKARPFWGGRKKTYFFFNYEGMRSRGAPVKPVLTVPTMKMRDGDFSEWPFPIYDPDTLRPNPAFDPNQTVGPTNLPYLRDQFMGCDGKTPNLICSSDARFANSLARNWLQYIPQPNRPSLENNYEVNLPSAGHGLGYGNTNAYVARADHYFGDKDHVFGTFHYRGIVKYLVSDLPPQIANSSIRDPNYNIIWR